MPSLTASMMTRICFSTFTSSAFHELLLERRSRFSRLVSSAQARIASAAISGAIIRSLRPASTRRSSSSRGMVRVLEQVPLLIWFEQAKRSAPRSE